jgi:hypothetical protein
MEQINARVDWSNIESLIVRNYPVRRSNEGNEADAPFDPPEISHPPVTVPHRLRIRYWKSKSTIGPPSRSFLVFPLISVLPTIQLEQKIITSKKPSKN